MWMFIAQPDGHAASESARWAALQFSDQLAKAAGSVPLHPWLVLLLHLPDLILDLKNAEMTQLNLINDCRYVMSPGHPSQEKCRKLFSP
jgi:hypothetical protein